MDLDDDKFLEVIDATPLVSIDLIIKNHRQEVLLGKRVNRPAKGYWFVPGGRIRKNEQIAHAIRRISNSELGIVITLDDTCLLGAYDAIYNDNFYEKKGVKTHYVVLAYQSVLKNEQESEIRIDVQHSDMKWWPVKKLSESPDVHENTKKYFLKS